MRNFMNVFITILCLFATFHSSVLAQTLEIENKILNDKMQKEGVEKVIDIAKAWKSFTSENNYPAIPYNPVSKEIDYSFIQSLSGISKKEIYTKIKEWVAIEYGSLREVLHYEDYETGKIIVKGYVQLIVEDKMPNFWGAPKDALKVLKCYHTVVFTVREQKLRIEFTNIDYESKTGGIISGTSYIPITISRYSIRELYPIVTKDKITWTSRISTLELTSESIAAMQLSINAYINESVKADRGF